MKKLISLLLLISNCYVQAQQQYITERDISYYADSINRKDPYIASQCKLDFYYPKGVGNYATIVWFHGGGLTGGKKAIPKALMEKGYAIVSVEYRFSPKVTAPAYIEDAAAAVAWVYQHIGRYGGNASLIFYRVIRLVVTWI
ncbi:alpha/beta hydrolase [Paraflavitalea speifideaquila]|uniref:alpha/beta hydrolase n=1 Tax=Paraflavitalea speifideaquila TaxID=3076558 RepID=UPI0028EBB223|nr:alpha/beta hydrolase [Paraflavitalea speifideiaquila]